LGYLLFYIALNKTYKMSISFTNYKGDKYFIKPKLTKKGNTTYYMVKKEEDTCLKELPDGYEVFEKPDTGMMFIRKIKKSVFNLTEIYAVKKELKKNENIVDYKLEINGDLMKIYTIETDESRGGNSYEGKFNMLLGSLGHRSSDFTAGMFRRFNERMRIHISLKKEERSFTFQRYCYKGRIDDWIDIGGGDNIKELAQQYVVHLGKMSYYELIGF